LSWYCLALAVDLVEALGPPPTQFPAQKPHLQKAKASSQLNAYLSFEKLVKRAGLGSVNFDQAANISIEGMRECEEKLNRSLDPSRWALAQP
jgi:hypothetical protein